MHPLLPRILSILGVHALGGWVFGAITAADSGSDIFRALLSDTAIQGAGAGGLVGLLWGWTLLLLGRRWYLGGLVAAPGALAGVLLYFLLWPVQGWEMPAWKAAGIVLTSYRVHLLVLTLLMGTLAAFLGRARPAPTPAPEG